MVSISTFPLQTRTTVLTVAANDSTAAEKRGADYICDGTSDDVQIQAALDALPAAGGEVHLMSGQYDIRATVTIGTSATTTNHRALVFTEGAKWEIHASLTGATTPALRVTSSNCWVWRPWISGNSNKDANIIGIQMGDPAQDQPGGVIIYNPYIDQVNCGIEFGVQTSGGTGSTGDCSIVGGRIRQCATGVRNAGFVNHVGGGIFISECTIGVHQDTSRNSGRINIIGATISQCSDASIVIDRGRGSFIDQVWIENTSTSGSNELVRIGHASHTVTNLRIGYVHLHPFASDTVYGMRLIRCSGMTAEHIEFTDDAPTTALLKFDSHAENIGNRIRKMSLGDTVPAGITDAKIVINSNTQFNSLAIDEFPGAVGAVKGITRGADMVPDPAADFTLFRWGTADSYLAKTREGYWAAIGFNTASTSGFKDILDTVLPDDSEDLTIKFAENTRFHFLDAPIGIEAWAATETFREFIRLKRVVLAGGGRSTIISNRTNYDTGGTGTDTEPLNFFNAQEVTIRDLTVEGCGSYKSTTDAIDLDQGAGCLVENVQVRSARGYGITIDGGDDGVQARGGTIRNNYVKGRPAVSQAVLSTGTGLAASTAYQYCTAWRVKDLNTRTITAATRSGTTLTVTTSAAHGYRVGEEVNIYDCDEPVYEQTLTIASTPTGTTFTATIAAAGGTGTTGTVIGPGSTKPSDPTDSITTGAGSPRNITITLDPGPYTCIGWDIYRYTSVWEHLVNGAGITSVTSLTSVAFVDDGTLTATGAGSMDHALTDHRSTVGEAGIRLLGASGCVIEGNVVDGVGDNIRGTSQYGIVLARKSTAAHGDPTSSFNRVIGNRVRQTASSNIILIGANDNIIMGNEVSNPGTVAAKAHGIRFEGVSTYTTHRNTAMGNVIRDDQSAASWSGGVSTTNSMNISSTNNPTGNRFIGNHCTGVTAAYAAAGTGINYAINNGGWINRASGATSVADAGTITHGLAATPTSVRVTTTVADEFAAVSAVAATTFTVQLTKHDGTAGTTQTVYWEAEVV